MKESSPMEEENLQSSSTGLEQELPLRMGIARGPRRGWRRPQRRDAGSCSSRARPPPPPATSTAILGLGIALLCAPLCWVDPSAASASGAEPGSEPGSVPVSEPGPGRGGGEVQWRRGWERRPDPRRAFAFRSRQDKGRRLRPRPGRNAEAVWDSTWGSAWDRGPITARTEDWGKSDGRGLAWGRNGVEGDGRSSQLRRAAGLRGRASAAAPSPAPKCAWCASLADGWHKDSNRSSASGPLCFLCQAGTLRRIESSGPHCPCAMESLRRGKKQYFAPQWPELWQRQGTPQSERYVGCANCQAAWHCGREPCPSWSRMSQQHPGPASSEQERARVPPASEGATPSLQPLLHAAGGVLRTSLAPLCFSLLLPLQALRRRRAAPH